jgi:hypothetical protein
MSKKGTTCMAISSHIMPRFIEEFRSLKLESLKKDLHKLNSDELLQIRKEVENLIKMPRAGEIYE